MLNIKIFVYFIICINVFCVCHTNYCEICLNHTMCKYNIPGPGPDCRLYESTALLTSQDITELLNKINERRNFVAMGYSKILPQAANMRKIRWSSELATFAQRWVDQCDESIRPDKEDECRDLENSKVSQNVASVAGPTPGLNVRSFVETWFIQVLDYTGSVIYYNQSHDYKTNYFTQLIWADTELVGCGKARFYVNERNTMLERLVCNFAPKGNNHARPVYTVGYGATQCPGDMSPDPTYKGLCTKEDYNLRKLQTQRPPLTSLLRILNLSNNSNNQDKDPIGSNLKQIIFNSNDSYDQKSQKIRHVFSNNSYSAAKRVPPFRRDNFWKNLINTSRNDENYLYQQERGHSHVYHGHETHKYNYGRTNKETISKDFRRYDYTTEPYNSYVSNNYIKHYKPNQHCTRKNSQISNDCTFSECTISHCTRGMTQNLQQTTLCQSTLRQIMFTNPVEHMIPHDLCVCTKKICPTVPAHCNCDTNCRCLTTPYSTNINIFTTPCPKIHRMEDEEFKDDTRKSEVSGVKFQYYDIPNIVIRSGNDMYKEIVTPKEVSWPYNTNVDTSFTKFLQNKGIKNKEKFTKEMFDDAKYQYQNHDYLYRSFDSIIRKRRQLGDQVKPFWQINEHNYKNLPELKALRYTTLGNTKHRKLRKHMEPSNVIISTEPITIKLEDNINVSVSHDAHVESPPRVTEKYLSFEELMHLRKFSDGYIDYDSRRKGDATTSKSKKSKSATKASTPTIKTSEITTNTPFERKKHCTRKLTCTWTAFTATLSDGKLLLPGGGELDMGSRTPHGYVDGCTRTSTCTREYMNKNKFSTLSSDNSEISNDEVGHEVEEVEKDKEPEELEVIQEDKDYCERRSLNIQKRNSDNKDVITSHQENYTSPVISIDEVNHPSLYPQNEIVSEASNCICNEEIKRKKRQENIKSHIFKIPDYDDDTRKNFSYADLYYLVLNKIVKVQKETKKYQSQGCQCNSTAKISHSSLFLFLIISHFPIVVKCFKYALQIV